MTSDLLPTLLGIALVVAAAAFALVPFATRQTIEPAVSSSTADRFQLYRQLLELEFDHDLGKLSDEDYRSLSAELLGQAGESLRQERGTAGELDAEIEHEIAAARAAFAAARGSATHRPAQAEASTTP
jgi:cytochrome c-type biogenesis protein CcmI